MNLNMAHSSKVEGVRFQGAPACNAMVPYRTPRGLTVLTNCGNDGVILHDGQVRCYNCIAQSHKK